MMKELDGGRFLTADLICKALRPDMLAEEWDWFQSMCSLLIQYASYGTFIDLTVTGMTCTSYAAVNNGEVEVSLLAAKAAMALDPDNDLSKNALVEAQGAVDLRIAAALEAEAKALEAEARVSREEAEARANERNASMVLDPDNDQSQNALVEAHGAVDKGVAAASEAKADMVLDPDTDLSQNALLEAEGATDKGVAAASEAETRASNDRPAFRGKSSRLRRRW